MDGCHRGPQEPLLRDSKTGGVPGRGPKGTGKSFLLLLIWEDTERRGSVSVPRLESEADHYCRPRLELRFPIWTGAGTCLPLLGVV